MTQQIGALDKIDSILKHDVKYRDEHPGVEALPKTDLVQYTSQMRSACKQMLAIVAFYEPLAKSETKTKGAAATAPEADKAKPQKAKAEKSPAGGPVCAKCKTPVKPACVGVDTETTGCCASCKEETCNSRQPCSKPKLAPPDTGALSFSFEEAET